jgi:hypothetical protein
MLTVLTIISPSEVSPDRRAITRSQHHQRIALLDKQYSIAQSRDQSLVVVTALAHIHTTKRNLIPPVKFEDLMKLLIF